MVVVLLYMFGKSQNIQTKSRDKMAKDDIGAGYCVLQVNALESALGATKSKMNKLLSLFYTEAYININGWKIQDSLDDVN